MMTLLDRTAALSSEPIILASALQEGCNLAVWERDALPEAETLLDSITGDIRFDAPIDHMASRLTDELDKAGIPFSDVRAAFADDVLHLIRLYADILKLNRVSVRVEIVTTDSCRKWHADYVTARLITTYAGSGTDWIDGSDAARVRNGLEPRQINSLKAGDVGMFRGKIGNDDPAIHRSPPIAGTDERRLLVVLNPSESD